MKLKYTLFYNIDYRIIDYTINILLQQDKSIELH